MVTYHSAPSHLVKESYIILIGKCLAGMQGIFYDMIEWIWIHMAINAGVTSTAGRNGKIDGLKMEINYARIFIATTNYIHIS